MTKTEAKQRLEQLRALIDQQRYLVHVLDKADLSEAALDSLKHELTQIEGEYPELITPDSPSQRVAGTPLPQFKKVRHTNRMFSLADVFSVEELRGWDERWKKIADHKKTNYIVDLKLDGLALSLRYERGVLVQVATRGDGFIGEDVTHTARTIESIPLRLRTISLPPNVRRVVEGGVVEIRGEAVMLKNDFTALNERQKKRNLPLFANPRNVSAGTIRQLDPKVSAERTLTFYAWELVSDIEQTTISEGYDLMKVMGIKTNPKAVVCKTIDQVADVHKKVEQEREDLPFWIDGMVVKLDSLSLYRDLGFIGKTPRAAVAWKFSAEQTTTVVEDIVIQVGRTGAMTPVAHLRPVQLGGTTVARATLHNADEVARLDVRIGDTVVLQKAGDIIPEVVRVLTELRPKVSKAWRMIRVCPSCSTPVSRKEGEAIHFCRNANCPSKQREQLYHFVSKTAFDIVGLGPQTIDVLVEEGLIHEPADLFSLKVDQLIGLPLFAEKKSEKLIESIQSRTTVSLDRFLYALGIRHVGVETARTLSQHFTALEKVQQADLQQLQSAPDIGGVVAESIFDFFHDRQTRSFVEHLQRVVTIQAPDRQVVGGPLAGKSVVVTGSLTSFTRSEAEDAIRSAGGHPTSSVSKQTFAVVVGEDPGSKAEKAKALGVQIWSEADFARSIGKKLPKS
jgi:DNA ligase (NAD+)